MRRFGDALSPCDDGAIHDSPDEVNICHFLSPVIERGPCDRRRDDASEANFQLLAARFAPLGVLLQARNVCAQPSLAIFADDLIHDALHEPATRLVDVRYVRPRGEDVRDERQLRGVALLPTPRDVFRKTGEYFACEPLGVRLRRTLREHGDSGSWEVVEGVSRE